MGVKGLVKQLQSAGYLRASSKAVRQALEDMERTPRGPAAVANVMYCANGIADPRFKDNWRLHYIVNVVSVHERAASTEVSEVYPHARSRVKNRVLGAIDVCEKSGQPTIVNLHVGTSLETPHKNAKEPKAQRGKSRREHFATGLDATQAKMQAGTCLFIPRAGLSCNAEEWPQWRAEIRRIAKERPDIEVTIVERSSEAVEAAMERARQQLRDDAVKAEGELWNGSNETQRVGKMMIQALEGKILQRMPYNLFEQSSLGQAAAEVLAGAEDEYAAGRRAVELENDMLTRDFQATLRTDVAEGRISLEDLQSAGANTAKVFNAAVATRQLRSKRVMIQGLLSEQSLNGLTGTTDGQLQSNGRVRVFLDDAKRREYVNVLEANIVDLASAEALKQEAEANIVGLAPDESRQQEECL